MYVGTISLCSCGGCERSLMMAGEKLVALLCEHSISFSNQLVDRHAISPSDVVLVSGCVRSSEEMALAKDVARTTRKAIALGTCAVYGGIPGMGPLPESMAGHEVDELPRLLSSAMPIDSVIDVDTYLPGCPPPTEMIFSTLKALLEGDAPTRHETTVCSECRRRVERVGAEWSEHPGHAMPPQTCLLSGGYLCLGPVTRGGCDAACPSVGSICLGCRGPSDAVLASELHSMYGDMVRYVAMTSGVRAEKIEKKLLRLLKQVYLFTCSDPVTRKRPREKVSKS